MHFCLLIGYGAGAINPYLAFETLADMIRDGNCRDIDEDTGGEAITSRRSTRASSRSRRRWASRRCRVIAARRFSKRSDWTQDVIDKYFTWTPSRVGGSRAGRDRARDCGAARYAYQRRSANLDGETGRRRAIPVAPRTASIHMYNPNTIAQAAAFGAVGQLPAVQGILAGWSTSRAAALARCAACSSSSGSAAGAD